MIDLLLGHPGTLGGTQGPFLLLAPFVDEAKILSVAADESVIRNSSRWREYSHVDQCIKLAVRID